MRISVVHAEHTEDSVGHVFDFDGIKVYISGDTKNNEKLKKVASFHPDVGLICTNGKPRGEFMNLNADEAVLSMN